MIEFDVETHSETEKQEETANFDNANNCNTVSCDTVSSDTVFCDTVTGKIHTNIEFGLIVDHRETLVKPYIDTIIQEFEVKYKQINIGDYVIYKKSLGEPNKIVAIIERKTLQDYAASMKDGRHGNRMKMLNHRKNTNCQLYYIIEGPAFPSLDKAFGRIPYASIESSIMHLMVNYNIMTIISDSLDTTAHKLNLLLKSYKKKVEKLHLFDIIIPLDEYKLLKSYENAILQKENNEGKFNAGNTNDTEPASNTNDTEPASNTERVDNDGPPTNTTSNAETTIINSCVKNNNLEAGIEKIGEGANIDSDPESELNSLTQKYKKTDERVMFEIWQKIPGISSSLSPILFKICSINDILQGRIDRILLNEKLKFSNGRSVKKSTISTILTLSHKEKVIDEISIKKRKLLSKMLSCIDGITEDLVLTLLQNVKTWDLISIDINSASEIKYKKSKIGTAKLEKIMKFIVLSGKE